MDNSSVNPSSQSPSKSKLLIIFVGLLLTILAAVIFIFISAKKPEENTKTTNILNKIGVISVPTTSQSQAKLTNLQIAEKALNWIDMFKDKNGLYYFGIQCYSDKECEQPLTDKQVGIIVIWSQYKNYKRTQNQNQLIKIKEQIKQYSEMTFQPDFWHCKLLHEMYKDDIFSMEEKEEIKKICDNSAYLSIGKAKSLAGVLNNFNSIEIIKKLESSSSSLIITDLIPSDEREFLMYSTYASDFIYKYFFTNNPNNLFIAKAYFDAAVSYYLSNKNKEISNLPYLGVAAIDIYKATGNKEYLDFAAYITNRMFVGTGKNITTNIGTVLLKNKMYITTDSAAYNNYAGEIKTIIDNNFDYPGYGGERKNLAGFHNGGKDLYYYSTRNTALMIAILSDEK